MRVLHINAGNLYGGIEVLLATLARARRGCPEIVPEFAVCFPGRIEAELRAADVAVHVLGAVRFSRPWTVWQARRNLRTLLRTGAYDAVVCHGAWTHALFGAVARQAGLPFVHWMHTPPESRLHWLERLTRRVPPDLILANSDYTMHGARRLFPQSPAQRIYCPVEFAGATSVCTNRGNTRAGFATPDDAVVLLQVGRWDPYKGHRLLIETLGRLRHMPSWVCWQVGGASTAQEERYRRQVLQLAQDAGIADRLRFLGFQDNRTQLPRIWQAADLYCQANTEPEPFGLVFIEALAAGLPVVTTAQGGPAEIVDATCGALVPPRDSAALAAVLERLIEDSAERQRLGANGPARARLISDPDSRLHELVDALTKLTAATPCLVG
jgi:glycosyltransferase involved in cell wall biosynthesis